MAERFDTLRIVTGGELKPGLPRIGAAGVGVPERFFKAILVQKNGEYRAVAYIIPNTEDISGTFRDYAVPVDEAERLTGFDFFAALPDDLENRIETQVMTFD
jgi:endonuclease G